MLYKTGETHSWKICDLDSQVEYVHIGSGSSKSIINQSL